MQVIMVLTCLVVCEDTHAVEVLVRVLADLGIETSRCADLSQALPQLSSQQFDAVIIDCKAEPIAMNVIAEMRRSSLNRSTLAIALIDAQNRVRDIFARGINFVIYKPVTADRAMNSLRAARGLMKRERRRHPRIALHAEASISYAAVENAPATVLELGESGMAMQCDRKLPPSCKIYLQFSLPSNPSSIKLAGEIAWQDSSGRVGIRFAHVPQSSQRVLKQWLEQNLENSSLAAPAQAATSVTTGLGLLAVSSADRRNRARHACRLSADVYQLGVNVPQRCMLSDISTGGCYVETTEPFPPRTKVEIIVRTQDVKVRVRGLVQTTHRGFGMGVQFSLENAEQKQQVQKLIALLASSQAQAEAPSETWLG
jgi:CheY-like chemotaxis protein